MINNYLYSVGNNNIRTVRCRTYIRMKINHVHNAVKVIQLEKLCKNLDLLTI